jgi:hypothetical protein
MGFEACPTGTVLGVGSVITGFLWTTPPFSPSGADNGFLVSSLSLLCPASASGFAQHAVVLSLYSVVNTPPHC